MSRRVAEGIYPDCQIVGSLGAIGSRVWVRTKIYPFDFPAIVSNPITQTAGLTVTVDGNGLARVFGSGVVQSLERVTEYRKTRFIPNEQPEIVRALLFVEVVNFRLDPRPDDFPFNIRPQWRRTLYVFDQDGNRTTVIATDWVDTGFLPSIGVGLDPNDFFTYSANGFAWTPGRGTLGVISGIVPDPPSFRVDAEGWYFDVAVGLANSDLITLMDEPAPISNSSLPRLTYSIKGDQIDRSLVTLANSYLGLHQFDSRFVNIPPEEVQPVVAAGVLDFIYVNINPINQTFFPVVPLTYSPVPNQAAGATGRLSNFAELQAALLAGLITEIPVFAMPETLIRNGLPEHLGFGYSGDVLSYNTFRFHQNIFNFEERSIRQASFSSIDLSFITLSDPQDKVFAATVGFVG